MRQETRFRPPLYWQSQLLLLIVVPVCCIWIFFQTVEAWERRDPVLVQTAGICIFFGLAVWIARAGTVPAIFTGVLVTACLYLRFPGRETALWCLVAMLTLTLAATRFGRKHKEKLGVAERPSGRSAAQVAANLGVAALACIPAHAPWVAAAGVCAALSESTADTLSSELGQVFGGRPRLMTTFRPVATGTDGGITLAGTACGCLGAATIAAVSAWTFHFDLKSGINVFSCGVLGLFLDSLLGATLERRGLLNNDAVNFLSTLASALCAERIAGLLGR
ncbi:MAG: DUF92 domain-containing protein [Bacillota bacterium]|nr:DUF92 domain-containing protein [Bacillota bacterium]